MSGADAGARSAPRPSFVERLAGFVAVAGGLLSLAIATLVVVSVLGRWLDGVPAAERLANALGFDLGPINGDFEMVQMATAVAVFSFLPYTQARRGNIFVDTFTSGLPARVTSSVDAFWDLVYAGMMGILAACLVVGTMEHYHSGQTTMLLQIIVWPAIAVSTLLLVLLAFVALATAVQRVRSGR